MHTVKICNETAESLFRDILKQDYRGLRNDIDFLLQKQGLLAYEKEDLDSWIRWSEAIAVVMEYYLPDHERKEILGEASNR